MTPPATFSLQNLTEIAKEDLAQRLSIPTTQISVIEAKAVTWSDSSLGCPQEGMVYAQVLTSGYLIVLGYSDNQYEYHAGKGPNVFYCPNPIPPVPNAPDNT
jgi:hypothetical protein